MFVGVGDDLILGEFGTGDRDDQRQDEFAPLVVGHTNDGDLGHGRMGEDHVLHLNGAHVLAARDDDVLAPITDDNVVGVVDGSAVAGVEPLGGVAVTGGTYGVGGGVGLFPVAAHDVVASGEDLAVGGCADLDAECRCPRTGQQRRPFAPREVVGLGASSVHRE